MSALIGEVVETKMAYKSNQKDPEGNLLPLGSIEVRIGGTETLMGQVRNIFASPATFNKRMPLIGEQVILFPAPVVIKTDVGWKPHGYIYLCPYNAVDDVSVHQFPKLWGRETRKAGNSPAPRLADDKEVGYTFKKDPGKSQNLQPFEGDDLWEGRHGQSIRFSRTVQTVNAPGTGIYEKQPPWKGTKNHEPIIVIKVKTPKGGGHKYDVEDLGKDDSSIYLTTKQKLTSFKPGFNKNKDVKTIGNWSGGSQIMVSSDRVTINSLNDKLILIGKTNAILTAEKIRFQTQKHNVDFDDLMDYINDLTKQLWMLTSAQKTFTTYMGPTGPATNVADMTKLHKVTFALKFKKP